VRRGVDLVEGRRGVVFVEGGRLRALTAALDRPLAP